MSPWDFLPTPYSVCGEAVQAVLDGLCVIIRYPVMAPDGLQGALSKRFGSSGYLISNVDLDGESILAGLSATLCDPDFPGNHIADLFTCRSTEDKIFCFSPTDSAAIEQIIDIMVEYSIQYRAHSATGRAGMVLLLCDSLASVTVNLQPSRGSIKEYDMGAVLAPIDSLTYASIALAKSSQPAITRELVAHLAANLGQWDLALIETLVNESYTALTAPQSILIELAGNHGWNAITQASYDNGGERSYGGRTTHHSFIIALNGEKEELKHHLWTAQAATLLPKIELRRREFLQRHSGTLRNILPKTIKIRNQEITVTPDQVGTLEWGQIAHLSRQENIFSLSLSNYIERLAKARNALSHMDTLSAADASHTQLHNVLI